MYLVLKKGFLKNITQKTFRKAGNIYMAEKAIGIPRSTLSGYHTESRLPSEENIKMILNFLGTQLKEKNIIRKLPNNWRQIKGGINRVKKARKNGTFEKQLKKAWKGAEGNAKWHTLMKKVNPRKYYLSQYEKFKKIGRYKFTTNNGGKVRNKLEKDVADTLKKFKIKYQYEPYINVNNKAFFPDFLINDKIIIECTAWRGYDKAIKLKNKIEILKNKYKIYVLIPEKLHKYYKIIDKNLIFDLNSPKTIFK